MIARAAVAVLFLLAPGAAGAACPARVADATLRSPPPRFRSLAYTEMPLRAFTRWQDTTTYDRAVAIAVGEAGLEDARDAIGALRTGACQGLFATAAPSPTLGAVAAQLDPLAPVSYVPGALVPVSGVGVVAGMQVGVGGAWSPIEPTASGGLAFALPRGVTAGTQVVQLGTVPAAGEPPVPVPGSSPQTLAIRPAIAAVGLVGDGLQVDTAPAVGPGQSVALALISVSGAPASASFELTAAAPTSELEFPLVPAPPAGEYIAVLSVDGVASVPEYDGGFVSSPLVGIG